MGLKNPRRGLDLAARKAFNEVTMPAKSGAEADVPADTLGVVYTDFKSQLLTEVQFERPEKPGYPNDWKATSG